MREELKTVDSSNLGTVWTRFWNLIKLLVGDVKVGTEGTLQEQITKHVTDEKNPHKVTAEQVGAIRVINARSTDYDMDTILKSGKHCAFYDTNASTLGTPYKYNVTSYNCAYILSYATSTTHGTQFAFSSGRLMFFRTLSNGNMSDWTTGYLPLVGGGLSGNMSVNKASFPYIILNDTTAGTDVRVGNYGNAIVIEHRKTVEDTSNRNMIYLMTTESELATSIRFRNIVNDVSTYYNIFGEHNKDLIAQSFLPLTGGVLSGNDIYLLNGLGGIYTSENDTHIASLNVANDNTNERRLGVSHSGTTENKSAVWYSDTVDGVDTRYNIFGEHNKDLIGESFLPRTGGDVNGNLSVNKSAYPYVILNDTTTETDARFANYGTSAVLELRDVKNATANRNMIYLTSTQSDLAITVRLRNIVDGVSTYYKIFGEHNVTCGNTDLTSGASALATGCIYQMYE